MWLPPCATQLSGHKSYAAYISLRLLRASWPGPLVCRWNLHRKHGAYGYDDAKKVYQPFNELVDPDPATRNMLAQIIARIAEAGFTAHVTINNKAEGSAPLSVVELAKVVVSCLNPRGADPPE